MEHNYGQNKLICLLTKFEKVEAGSHDIGDCQEKVTFSTEKLFRKTMSRGNRQFLKGKLLLGSFAQKFVIDELGQVER
jgi:hypothetical protein